MIKLLQSGNYRLVGTRKHTTILYLDGARYVWLWAKNIGQILEFTKASTENESYLLAEGKYKLYTVKDEPHLIDLPHLQLSLGAGKWQSYLLLNGLPTARVTKRRIVHTDEVIK